MEALQASRQAFRQAPRQLALWLIPASVTLSGCAAVKGIFKAGVWVGVVAVVALLAVAALLMRVLKS
jgi:hypothetical protein